MFYVRVAILLSISIFLLLLSWKFPELVRRRKWTQRFKWKECVVKIFKELFHSTGVLFATIAVATGLVGLLTGARSDSVLFHRALDNAAYLAAFFVLAYYCLRYEQNFLVLVCVVDTPILYAVVSAITVDSVIPKPYFGLPLFLTEMVLSVSLAILVYINIEIGKISREKFERWKAVITALNAVGTVGLFCSTFTNLAANRTLSFDETFNILVACVLVLFYPFYVSLLMTDALQKVETAAYIKNKIAWIRRIIEKKRLSIGGGDDS